MHPVMKGWSSGNRRLCDANRGSRRSHSNPHRPGPNNISGCTTKLALEISSDLSFNVLTSALVKYPLVDMFYQTNGWTYKHESAVNQRSSSHNVSRFGNNFAELHSSSKLARSSWAWGPRVQLTLFGLMGWFYEDNKQSTKEVRNSDMMPIYLISWLAGSWKLSLPLKPLLLETSSKQQSQRVRSRTWRCKRLATLTNSAKNRKETAKVWKPKRVQLSGRYFDFGKWCGVASSDSSVHGGYDLCHVMWCKMWCDVRCDLCGWKVHADTLSTAIIGLQFSHGTSTKCSLQVQERNSFTKQITLISMILIIFIALHVVQRPFFGCMVLDCSCPSPHTLSPGVWRPIAWPRWSSLDEPCTPGFFGGTSSSIRSYQFLGVEPYWKCFEPVYFCGSEVNQQILSVVKIRS